MNPQSNDITTAPAYCQKTVTLFAGVIPLMFVNHKVTIIALIEILAILDFGQENPLSRLPKRKLSENNANDTTHNTNICSPCFLSAFLPHSYT